MRPRLTVQLLSATLLAAPFALAPTSPASAQIGIGVGVGVGVGVGLSIGLTAHIAPPPLPVYEPPPLPGEGYLWVPGYWAYGDAGYYWVPGTWILPPRVGLLWTPCYWGWSGGVYAFHAGYWGPHVGFYGGINYGFGYTGNGFFGGEWRNGGFAYNTAVYRNFGGVHVTNVYNQTIINRNVNVTRVSFNGPNGIQARPTPQEESYAHEQHVAPPPAQLQHVQAAARDRSLLASANGGHPAIAAVARPAVFHGPGVVAAHEAAAHEAAAHVPLSAPGHSPVPTVQRPSLPVHSGFEPHAPMAARPTPPNPYHPAAEHREALPPHQGGPMHPAMMPRPAPHPAPRPAPARHGGEPKHH